MVLRINAFSGLYPGIAEQLRPDGSADVATNVRLVSGALSTWLEPLEVYTPNPQTTWPPYQTIFRYQTKEQRGTTDAYYLTYLEEVELAVTPIASDIWDRVYATGAGSGAGPQVISNDSVAAGAGAYPQATYLVGVPAPTTAPTVTVTGAMVPDPPDPTTGIDYAAVYTYVNEYGEEGPPSTASSVVTVYPGQSLTISGLGVLSVTPPFAENYRPIQYKRVYLSVTSATGTQYQQVQQVAADDDSITIPYTFSDFSTVLETDGWEPPPTKLRGIKTTPWGSMVGYIPNSPSDGSGNVVRFTPPYQVHAWPPEYELPVAEQIQGVGIVGNSVIVLTDGLPSVVTGTNPTALTIDRVESGYSCVSRRGIVDVGGTLVYPCPSGLAFVSMQGSGLLTEGIVSEREWAAFYPHTIHGAHYNGHYIGFWDSSYSYNKDSGYVDDGYVDDGYFEAAATSTRYGYTVPRATAQRGGFIFNVSTKQLTLFDSDEYTAAFSYDAGGKLIVHSATLNKILRFDAGVNPIGFNWQSKPYYTMGEEQFSAYRVFAASYPLTFEAEWTNEGGIGTHLATVASAEPKRLPFSCRGNKFKVRVQGSSEVRIVEMATSLEELGRLAR